MTQRLFGIKDIFTTINCLGGAVALFLCVEGYPFAAGVAIIVGYLCGDALDGWVARKLGTANDFGAEYDTISDHLAHTIAPALIVYSVYADSGLLADERANQIVGGVLGSALVVTATIRHARNVVQPIDYAGIWSGLPRTVGGFLAIGYILSFTVHKLPVLLWGGLLIIPLASWATLTRLPFANHRLPRKHYLFVRVLVALTFVLLIGAITFYPRVLFDCLFFAIAAYTLGSATILTRQERNDYRSAVRRAVEGSA